MTQRVTIPAIPVIQSSSFTCILPPSSLRPFVPQGYIVVFAKLFFATSLSVRIRGSCRRCRPLCVLSALLWFRPFSVAVVAVLCVFVPLCWFSSLRLRRAMPADAPCRAALVTTSRSDYHIIMRKTWLGQAGRRRSMECRNASTEASKVAPLPNEFSRRLYWPGVTVLLAAAMGIIIHLWACRFEGTLPGDMVFERSAVVTMHATHWGTFNYRTTVGAWVSLEGQEFRTTVRSEVSRARVGITFACNLVVWVAALTIIGNLTRWRDSARGKVPEFVQP